MGYTVRGLCELPALAGATLLTGEPGLDNPVEQVAPAACRALWESAGDAVLTLFEPHLGAPHILAENELPLSGGKVAGVVCKAAAPGAVPPELLQACTRFGVPLLVLPEERRWVDVFPSLMAVFNGDASTDPIREAFLRVTLSGGGIHGILELLRMMAERPVLMLNPAMQILDHSGRTIYKADLQNCQQAAVRGTSQSMPIHSGGKLLGFLNIAEMNGPVPPEAQTALKRAAEMAGWQHVHDSRRRLDWNARTQFLAELLLGRFTSANSARTWASVLGVQLAPSYLTIVVAIDNHDDYLGHSSRSGGGSDILKERIADIVDDTVQATAQGSLAVGFSDSVAVALGLPATVTPREAQHMGRKLAVRIQTTVQQAFRDLTVTIGIGPLVTSVADLPRGYAQARQIASLGGQLRGAGGIHCIADLGFFRLLGRIEDKQFLAEFARDILGPLEEHDASGQAPILPTLRAFLAADGQRLRCASELYLHPNTVSYRLGLVEKLTGLSPFRTEDRFLLQAALKVLQQLAVLADDGVPTPLGMKPARGATPSRKPPESKRANHGGI